MAAWHYPDGTPNLVGLHFVCVLSQPIRFDMQRFNFLHGCNQLELTVVLRRAEHVLGTVFRVQVQRFSDNYVSPEFFRQPNADCLLRKSLVRSVCGRPTVLIAVK